MRRLLPLGLALSLGLSYSPPADAFVGALLKAAKLAGKAGKSASTAGKAAKGASTAGKAAKIGGVALAADSLVVVGGRGARALAKLPDDVGGAAAYVGRNGDDITILDRAGAQASHAEASWASAADELRHVDQPTLTIVFDPTAAAKPPPVSSLDGATNIFVADAKGTLHPVTRTSDDMLWVDVGDVSFELAQFGADALLELEAEAAIASYEAWLAEYDEVEGGVHNESDESSFVGTSEGHEPWQTALFGGFIVVVGIFSYREYRKPSRRLTAEEWADDESPRI